MFKKQVDIYIYILPVFCYYINRNFSGSEVYLRRRYTSKPRFHKHLCKKTQHRRVISDLIFNSAVELLHTLSFS